MITEKEIRELHKAYWERGLSFRQLEELSGLDKDRIRYHFNKYSLRCRTRKRAVRIARAQGRGGTLEPRRGDQVYGWKGGRIIQRGYVLLRDPEHPRAHKNGYVFEHLLIWEKEHGPLPKGWHIHHINGSKADNRPENLLGMPAKDHMRYIAMQQEKIRELEEEIRRLRCS